MSVEQMIVALEKFEALHQEWCKPVDEFIEQNLPKVHQGQYKYAKFKRELADLRARQLAMFDPDPEVFELLDKLCPLYLKALAEERELIRATVIGKSGVQGGLVSYIYRAAKHIQTPDDVEWLRLGLAAASIENCARDYRDVLFALAEIYIAAERAGINPQSDFNYAASLSSNEKPSGGDTPVSEMLSHFHEYAILKERKAQSS